MNTCIDAYLQTSHPTTYRHLWGGRDTGDIHAWEAWGDLEGLVHIYIYIYITDILIIIITINQLLNIIITYDYII